MRFRFIFSLILAVINIILYFPPLFSEEENISNKLFPEDYNVILISICSLRFDHLSCYGYNRKTSPNIDSLAKEGIIFKNTFSQASYTLPSMMSIHTSLYPASHRVFFVGKDILSSNIKTLAEILNNSGYNTAYFFDTNHLHMDPNIGFGRGFGYIENIYPLGKKFFIGKEIEGLLKWVNKMKNKKFFLCYHNLNIHSPYLPSVKYKKKFLKDYKNSIIISSAEEMYNAQLQLIKFDLKNPQSEIYKIFKKDEINHHPEVFQGQFNHKKMIRLFELINSSSIQKKMLFWHLYDVDSIFFSQIDKDNSRDLQYLQDLYDACILELDQKIIGPLVKELKILNLYDKTMIIILSDHGDEFNEHGDIGHRNLKLYDELIHIPLIIKLPKCIYYNHNEITELVQSIDIMPTILNILNIAIPKQAQGISLKRLWEARENSAMGNEYVYAQNPNMESIRSNECKLIRNLSQNYSEFYELKTDAQEIDNHYNQKHEMANRLENDLDKWENNLFLYNREKGIFFRKLDDNVTQERMKKTGYW